jgi:DNA-binding NarL/FixJ family response regulator
VTRVFIVADARLARPSLENMLASRAVTVIGKSHNLDSALDQIPDAEPDALLIEVIGENAKSSLQELVDSEVAQETAVVVLRDQPSPDWFADALRAGVRAILPMDVSPKQLVAAIEAATLGLVTVHPREINAIIPAASVESRQVAELAEPLTARESEVLQMLASGLGNKQIAARLSISEHTVKFHVASILGKLGAATRTEAVSIGIRHGLVLL